MSKIPSREEALFVDALAQPPAERGSFLAKACGADAILLARVAALIAAHDGPESLMVSSVASRPTVSPEEKPGDWIGRYKLLQKIGEGGCGVVWMAEQEEPVRRRVALKIIKLGMDTKAVVARFEAERQALAMMDHPNIAKVHDAGATETGRPFFVMELVRGIPITKYCDENHLNPTERLELFIKVCQAIQHAHQKGIIHRDIKPSNILVTVNDGAATPKVIDFGIAKATQGKLTDATVFTAFEQFIGTPVYMSPEQAEMSSLDIDTRSDIYSLGVLLYELLMGKPPFDPKMFAHVGVDQIRRQIREIEPAKPSRRLGTLDDNERTTIARLRNTGVAQLAVVLRGDLDWIVMRCLEKDRTRRYDTANGLAMDIQRFLRNEPVIARPPSSGYLLRKLIRRHRFGFAAATAISLVISIGGAAAAWQAFRALRAEREQGRLRAIAQQAQASEVVLRRSAEREALNTRREAYASDMNLVQQALETDNLGRAQELLNRHRPEQGQTDLRNWEWRYQWQFARSDALSVLARKLYPITSVSLSNDRSWLAFGEHANGGVTIRNVHSLEELQIPAGDGHVKVVFAAHEPLLAASFTSESRSAAPQFGVLVWSLAARQKVAEIPLRYRAMGLALSADGTTLVTCGQLGPREIELWRVADGTRLASYPADATSQNPLAVSPDMSLAAHSAPGGMIRVIDLRTGMERWTARATNGSVLALEFSPDGRVLATGSGFVESVIRLWDAASGRELGRLEGHRSTVRAFAFRPDGKALASGSADQTIRIWDLERHRLLNTLRGHELEVWSLAWLSDNHLVSGGKDGLGLLWDTTAKRAKGGRLSVGHRLRQWGFAGDGESVVTLDADARLQKWSGDTLGQRSTLREFPKLTEIRLARDCALLAGRTSSGQIEVWDWDRGLQVRYLETSGDLSPVSFLDRGKKLILVRARSGDLRTTLHEWELASAKETRFWPGPPSSSTFSCAFSSDNRRVVMLGWEGASSVLDLATGEVKNLRLNLRLSDGPRFSPDGRLLAAPCRMGFARLWDGNTFRELATLSGFMQAVRSVNFSPDGQRLVTGSIGPDAIKIWDVESHQELITLPGGETFTQLAFSPDGNTLGALSEGVLHLWRVPSWEEIEARERAGAATGSR